MKDLFKIILKNAKKNKTYAILIILIFLLKRVNEAIELINKVLYSRLAISLFCIIIFFFLKKIFNDLLIYEYPRKLVKYAKIGLILNYILIFIPIYFFVAYLMEKKNQENICDIDRNKVGILIASFEETKNGGIDEAFSSTLYGKLNAGLQFVDTINLRLLKENISESGSHYQDTIKSFFAANCSMKGLIIFGSRKDEKYFNCRIYSYNFLNLQSKGAFETRDSTIVYIQNPGLVDFSVESESTVVSKFVLGLLYYHAGQYNLSNQSFTEALNLNLNPNNYQFISLCHLFQGNGFVCQGDVNEAIKEYTIGVESDSNNPYLRYNLAVLYNNVGFTSQAYAEFEKAHQLKNSFKNPLLLPKETKFGNVPDKVSNIPDYNPQQILENYPLSKKSIEWVVSTTHGKYGLFTAEGDTISNSVYDNIEKVNYKQNIYYIVKLDRKFGAFIKKANHSFNEEWHVLPLEYSSSTIRKVVENCIDNHFKD